MKMIHNAKLSKLSIRMPCSIFLLFLYNSIHFSNAWWTSTDAPPKPTYMPLENDTPVSRAPFICPATAKHTATIIMLHGLGGTGENFKPMIPKIQLPYIKVLCPTANRQFISVQPGGRARTWYDRHLSEHIQDVSGIKNATIYMHNLIDKEIESGIPPERIIIGGFSNGGSLALRTGLTFHKKLGGIIVLCAALPLYDEFVEFSDSLVTANRGISILHCHGERDPTVSPNLAKRTIYALKPVTTNITYKVYPDVEHEIPIMFENDMEKFIKERLPPV